MHGTFAMSDGSEFRKNVILLGVVSCSSWNPDDRKKYIFIFGKGATNVLDNTL